MIFSGDEATRWRWCSGSLGSFSAAPHSGSLLASHWPECLDAKEARRIKHQGGAGQPVLTSPCRSTLQLVWSAERSGALVSKGKKGMEHAESTHATHRSWIACSFELLVSPFLLKTESLLMIMFNTGLLQPGPCDSGISPGVHCCVPPVSVASFIYSISISPQSWSAPSLCGKITEKFVANIYWFFKFIFYSVPGTF